MNIFFSVLKISTSQQRKLLVLTFLCSILPSLSYASDLVSLDEVLKLAEQNSNTVRAINQSLGALDADIRSRDLILSPKFSSELALLRTERQALDSTSDRDENSGLLDVTLAKPFATGTTFSVNAANDTIAADDVSGEQDDTDWEVRLSQSLWRDSFGRSTDLRRQGEASEHKSRRFAALSEKQQFLVNVENAYWDLALAFKEESIREANIKTSVALEKWTRDRMGQYAAEPTDLLQVQTLLSQRKLDLAIAKNSIESVRNRLRQFIPNTEPSTWKLNLNSLEVDREPQSLIVTDSASLLPDTKPMRLDALAAAYRSKQFNVEAARIADNLKPGLDAYVSYGDSNNSRRFDTSSERTSRDSTEGRLGLLFSVDLDSSLKEERRRAAQFNADSQESRAQALMRESNIGWEELQRNILNLRGQVKEARELADLQRRKVTTERVRFEQGRTSTFQMTTFEVDAAESELRLYRLLAALRKAESNARSFAYDTEPTS